MKFSSTSTPDTGARRVACGRDGFTLVEVLVAFTILALLTIAIQRGVTVAIGGTARARERVAMEMVARTLLTAPLRPGADAMEPESGRLDGYGWVRRFEAADAALPTAASADGAAPAWRPVRMIVRVSNIRKGGPDIEVETIRLARMGP